jgi:hypothetical protein
MTNEEYMQAQKANEQAVATFMSPMQQQKLTQRQADVLSYVRSAQVVGSGHDRSVLEALERKGLVLRSQNSAPGYVYFTWSLTAAGREAK